MFADSIGFGAMTGAGVHTICVFFGAFAGAETMDCFAFTSARKGSGSALRRGGVTSGNSFFSLYQTIFGSWPSNLILYSDSAGRGSRSAGAPSSTTNAMT